MKVTSLQWATPGCLAVALGVLAAMPAAAQEATEAQLLYERGAELYRERRLGEALEAMVASNRLVPNANVVFNVAQIYELLERPIDAFNWYHRHLGFELSDQARARARARIAALQPRVAVLDIESAPAGATVFIDRVELGAVGTTPSAIAVRPGDHRVILRLPGYAQQSVQTSVTTGQRTGVSLSLQRLVGQVELASEPPGASVFAGGAALGETPLSVELPAGQARLTLRLDGYLEQSVELSVQPSETVRHHARLSRDPARFASLVVAARPDDATVWIDGRRAGSVPLTLEGLSPGPRRLEVRRAAHEQWKSQLQLAAGSTTHVDARLVADADKPWPYWRWVGYGSGAALFAGGAAVGVAAVAKNQSHARADSVERLNHIADGLMAAGLLVAAVTLLLDLTAGPPPHSSAAVETRP